MVGSQSLVMPSRAVRSPDELSVLFGARSLEVTPPRQCIFRVLHGNDGHPIAEMVSGLVPGPAEVGRGSAALRRSGPAAPPRSDRPLAGGRDRPPGGRRRERVRRRRRALSGADLEAGNPLYEASRREPY